MDKNTRLERLRMDRAQKIARREAETLRTATGETIAMKAGTALNLTLELSDFKPDLDTRARFEVSRDNRQTAGLVRPYTDESEVMRVLECCERCIGPQSGVIWFDEYAYMGYLSVSQLSLLRLAALTRILNDSVFLWCEAYLSAFQVDYYDAVGVKPTQHWSVAVQGEALETTLKDCFSNVVFIEK